MQNTTPCIGSEFHILHYCGPATVLSSGKLGSDAVHVYVHTYKHTSSESKLVLFLI